VKFRLDPDIFKILYPENSSCWWVGVNDASVANHVQ